MKGDPMPEELIIKHCSPTLAGIKTGNIITCRETDREENRVFVRHLNSILVPKGLRAMLFSRGEDLSEMIYIYRPEKLKKDLSDETAREILEKTDYPVGNPTYCVIKLLERLRHSSGFPHEIGLFLGYTAEDGTYFRQETGGIYSTGRVKLHEKFTLIYDPNAPAKVCAERYALKDAVSDFVLFALLEAGILGATICMFIFLS